MGVLDFIFGLIVLFVILIIVIGVTAMKYDSKKLEEENLKLKEDLKKARLKKSQSEYKKVKEVKNEK